MAIYSLYIISKSGSLLYQRDFKTPNSPIKKQNSNDYLIIASNLHGIHTIAAKLTPSAAKPNSSVIPRTNNSNSTTTTTATTTTTTTSTTSAPSTSSNIINSPDSNIKRNDSSIQIERERSEIRNSIASLRNSITGDDNIDLNSNSNSNSNKRDNSNGININSNKTGLRSVQTEKFNMFIYQTVTGIKIIILTSIDLNEYQISNFQIIIYKLYSDYVMKNPFYSLDMPIRIKLFDDKIMSAVINYNIK